MKKVFNAIIMALIVLMPMGVLAAPTFEVTCNKTSVKKSDAITCSLNLTSLGANEKLVSVTGSYAVNSILTTSGTTTFSKTDLNISEATDGVVTFNVLAGQTRGDGTVTVTLTGAGGTTTTPASCSDEQYTTQETCEAADPAGEWTAEVEAPATFTTNNPEAVTIKVLDNSTAISSVKIDDVVNSTCSVTETGCTLTGIKKASMKTTVTAVNTATVKGDGTFNLNCGANSQKVTITPEDGSAARTYTFNINRTCDNTTTLKGITLSTGNLNPTFSANTKNYKIEVSSNIDKITIAGIKAVDSQTITGEVKDRALQYGDNKFVINVKSESGSTSGYNLTVTRKDDRNTNNDLKEITLSDGKLLPVFDKDTKSYTAKVLFEIKKVKVTAKAESDKATIEYVNNEKELVVGENTIQIKVKSENQVEQIYEIKIERLKEGETLGDNPNLTSIKVKGYDLGFSYDKNAYTLKIEKEDKLDISVEAEESTTTFEIKGNKDLKNGSVITITTTSKDGTTKDYRINIEKTNIVLFIIIAGVTLLIAIGLIVYLVIKNKKDKDSLTTTKVKKQLKHDDEILAKVQNQLNEIEKTQENVVVPQITPIESEPTKEELVKPDLIKEAQPATRIQYMEQQRNEEVQEKPKTEATRVCSICGHRVSVTLNTCPYCKRSF